MRAELVIRSILQTTATKSERPRQCWQAAHISPLSAGDSLSLVRGKTFVPQLDRQANDACGDAGEVARTTRLAARRAIGIQR